MPSTDTRFVRFAIGARGAVVRNTSRSPAAQSAIGAAISSPGRKRGCAPVPPTRRPPLRTLADASGRLQCSAVLSAPKRRQPRRGLAPFAGTRLHKRRAAARGRRVEGGLRPRRRPTPPVRGRGSGAQRSEHPQAPHPCPAASAGVPGVGPRRGAQRAKPVPVRPLSTTPTGFPRGITGRGGGSSNA